MKCTVFVLYYTLSRQSVIQSVSGQQLLAVDVAVTTMLKQIDVPKFLVDELRKTGSRSIRTVADLARELQRSQARPRPLCLALPCPAPPRPGRAVTQHYRAMAGPAQHCGVAAQEHTGHAHVWLVA